MPQVTVKRGDFLTAAQVQEWLDEEHCSFWDTFQPNLQSDWRDPSDIARRLERMANRIDPLLPSYDSQYGVVEVNGGACGFKPCVHAALA